MPEPTYTDCIAACKAAADAAEECAAACRREEAPAGLLRCIALDEDCVDVCRLAIALMKRKSESAVAVIEVCADVCKACAEECEQHDHMEHCRVCAQACRRCVDACVAMAQAPRNMTAAVAAAL
ncbi:MAG TPA: four-helix bundle copper-binding protein [Burkholderiaceae bacterium]|nr:four-helix bundle copper-binding protein [Burkholderiaceae bacterium]